MNAWIGFFLGLWAGTASGLALGMWAQHLDDLDDLEEDP